MKKKIFFTFILLLLILFFILITDSKATFSFTGSDGKTHNVPDLKSDMQTYYMISLDGNGYYDILYGKNPIVVNTDGYLRCSSGTTYRQNFKNGTDWATASMWSGHAPASTTNIIYTNHNIIDVSTKEVFYYAGINEKPLFEVVYAKDNTFAQITSVSIEGDIFDNTECYISFNNTNNYIEMNIEDTRPSFNTCVYYYDVYRNGTYYIKYINNNDGSIYEISFIVDKINEFELNLHLSTYENTTEPIYLLSNKYYYEGEYNASKDWLNNYDIELARGLDSPYEYNPLTTESTDDNGTYRQYQFKIVVNGVYKAKIIDLLTGEISYEVFYVDNIGVKNPYGEDVFYNNYNENGEFDPTPVLFLDYINTSTVRIRTQPFIFNELIMLECYFSTDGENYEKINNIYNNTINNVSSSLDLNTGDIISNNLDTYYFYYDVSADGIYYFKFYNIELKKETVASIEVNINEFLLNNIDNIEKYPDKFIIWANKHFGFLTYPFTFIVNFFGRLNNINYSEPVLHIPELRDPFNNNKILNATDFNFNSILTNDITKTIYNIYLISVDVILIVLFLSLCKKVFEEVFSK